MNIWKSLDRMPTSPPIAGTQQVVVLPGVSGTAVGEAVQTAIKIALARGHRWLRQIESGKVANPTAIAKAENVDNSYARGRLFKRPFPSPRHPEHGSEGAKRGARGA